MAKSLTVAVCVAWQFFMHPGPGIVNTALLLTGEGCSGGNPVAEGATAFTTTLTLPTEAKVVAVVPFTVETVELDVGMVPRATEQVVAVAVVVQQLPFVQELVPPAPAVEVILEIVEFGERVSVKIPPLTGSPWL